MIPSARPRDPPVPAARQKKAPRRRAARARARPVPAPKAAPAPGRLISFEGPEGSGKSTQIAHLARRLEAEGRGVIVTREPGGTPIGEAIRHLIKHAAAGDGLCAEAELLLFAASRAQHVRQLICPALAAGHWVLTDRFLDSTTVYQGMARTLGRDPVEAINCFAVGETLPALTIVVDVPAEVSLERIRRRASDLPDRMERENIDFYRKIREGYLVLARSLPQRFCVVDGTQPEDRVAEEIWRQVRGRVG